LCEGRINDRIQVKVDFKSSGNYYKRKTQQAINSQGSEMDIGEVAKASGLPASTLRFYEEKELIKSTGRNGLRRQYATNVIQRLALITLGRNAGLSLSEIGTMFKAQGPQINRTLLSAKAEQLDSKIKELTAMRFAMPPPAQRQTISNARNFCGC
jgi:DNA-binding transcriptional MerR regulator